MKKPNESSPAHRKIDELEVTMSELAKSFTELCDHVAFLQAKVKAIGTKLGFESK